MPKLQISFLIFILFNFTTEAQVIWESTNGPNGGLVADIGINSKGWLYAGGWGSGTGLYRSKDEGKTWTKCNNGYDDFEIFTIAVNSNDDIYIGNDWQGMLRSTDDGETWEVMESYPLVECWAITFDKSGSIYAGDGDWGGVMKSTDNGISWNNWIHLGTLCISIGPNGYVYTGTWKGIYRSTDEGVSWSKMSDGLPDLNISCIEFDSSGTVYLGTGSSHNKGNGIYYSQNNGETWTHLALSDTTVQSLVLIDNKILAGTLNYGIVISSDSGKKWVVSNNGLMDNNVFRIRMASDSILFTASDRAGGIHKSTDLGHSWKQIGPPRGLVESVAKNNKGQLYVGSNGVNKLELNSGEWTNLGLNDFYIHCIRVKNDTILFAGTDLHGLYRSTNEGITWERISSDSNSRVVDIEVQRDGSLLLAESKNLFISYDDGETMSVWSNEKSYPYLDEIEINHAGDIFIANSKQVFRCLYNSFDFKKIFEGNSISGISVNDPDRIFISEAGDSGGIYVSENNGVNWEKSFNGDVSSIFVTNGLLIFAAVYNHGIIISSDHGLSWDTTSTGLDDRIYTTIFSEDKNHIIYAGTYKGLYRTKTPVTEVKKNSASPAEFKLKQNFPNPFNPQTVIRYSLANNSRVSLKVYDLLGKEVVSLVNLEQSAGSYTVEFDAGALSTGIYVYQIIAGSYIESKKMILLK